MEFFSSLVTLLLLVLRLFSVSTTTFAENDTITPSDVLRDNISTDYTVLLVSKQKVFGLGFFTRRTDSSSNNRYLGIFTAYGPIAWVANRCNPIQDSSSGSLSIDKRGNLVLYSGHNDDKRVVVWSTNSSKQAAKPLFQLLDNGNLVLRDEEDANTTNYLWESFDYPTDSLLPGMKLGWDLKRGLNRRLSSWNNSFDSCDGDLITYGIEFDEQHHTYPQLIVRVGSAILYRQGMWDAISSNQNSSYEFVQNDDEVYYSLKNKSMVSILVLQDDGSVSRWEGSTEDREQWSISATTPVDQCDSYGFCGANSQCVLSIKHGPMCQCLEGFKPKNQEEWNPDNPQEWNPESWSEGCESLYSLASCHEEEKEEFHEYVGLRVPDTKNSWLSKANNGSECKSKCSSNCSCMAYSFIYSESNVSVVLENTNCVLWFGDLFDIRQLPSGDGGGQNTHIRIPSSKIESRTDPNREEKAKEKAKVKVKRVVMIIIVLRLFCVSTTTFAVVHNDTIRSTDVLRDHNSINAFLVSKTLLVSKEGRFAVGFFNPTGGFFNHRYLGIWYNNITSYSDVVWVANRCEPIIVTSGLLSIDNRGNLVLFSEENNSKREIVWSTNSSKQAAKPLVQLLDNGNLVLRDEKDDNTTNYLWESFDYPTDSLLPGMKLGWDLRRGLNRRLSSWKSSDDPCHGNFTYGIEFDEELHTYPQLIARNGTAIFYRQGMWDSISSSQNSGYEFVYNDDEVFYIQNNKSMISRIVMKDDGSIEHQDWRENLYSLIWPGDQCDSYGFCGANSQCNVTDITQDYGICYCLKGFKQKNQEQWSEGCERLYSPASCHDEEKEEFREYLGMRVPDTKNSLVSKSNNASECESKCLTNCSCMAYSFTYTESNVFVADTVCVLWFGDLFDIRQLPSGGGGGQTTHIRIPNSKIGRHTFLVT
ncbi:hypothetical protein F8388_023776 [Cannabis sativa]|uniref:non-specific serine/threonine protein kinase n=1 Tax=Cannabis sativa TaxID=3483 RepID=A0A7J6GCA5_CANSA|nr:hypothetical protein F8388_023776 [Cannabis sativa]